MRKKALDQLKADNQAIDNFLKQTPLSEMIEAYFYFHTGHNTGDVLPVELLDRIEDACQDIEDYISDSK